jgi:preprotein translocase subunit SecE
MNHCPSFRGSDAFWGSNMYTKRYGYIIKHRREQKKVEYLKRIQSATTIVAIIIIILFVFGIKLMV